ncbi:hypothetical protein PpBr36_03141 [Pyricularia pennisetigena]|uniref:hypothetical protein n=1 Tax=Pyricularia pennisetigena TaxID=1578925 RepID=UPI00114E79B2|nr:hypothetical protein PpBr36_03141 [Pyricularia pennisetigena]TLS30763.1 hypothetical protein PpBr36_03141 [Pyricularia pennisetigena]
MATQQDVQELLRLLVGARKLPMLRAMAQVKALQVEGLKSIRQVAEADQAAVERAFSDAKAARALQNACKAAVKRGDSGVGAGSGKRAGSDADAGANKRAKTAAGSSGDGSLFGLPSQMTPQELEESLDLPVDMDEERIAATSIECNRAPLVLAFAAELLRYTMPEQPPSSRLSIAQAVVAANSRSKATSLGIEKGIPADREGWGEGQPRVRVMGREVSVLKRGGYEWKGSESVEKASETKQDAFAIMMQNDTQESRTEPATSQQTSLEPKPLTWSTSQSVSLKESTFIARATTMSSVYDRKKLFAALMEKYPVLKTATHNAWAYRVKQTGSGRVTEDSFDDGETGCGKLMLEVMRESDAVDTFVVLTRWFGGIMLGPDRWRLMRTVVRGALSERMRLTGTQTGLGGEAVWGLDLEAMRSKSTASGYGSGIKHHETTVVGMQVHRPEAARDYLLKSFATGSTTENTEGNAADTQDNYKTGSKDKKAATAKKKTIKAVNAEKEENLALLLGALRLLYDSWADHLPAADMDRRAWSWYTAVRPEVDSGPSGWGAKGVLNLQSILDLRRKE